MDPGVFYFLNLPFKRQSHKMVKHTQTIRRQIADELFECVWPFCETGTKRVKVYIFSSRLLWSALAA